jgi:hypothetical protein
VVEYHRLARCELTRLLVAITLIVVSLGACGAGDNGKAGIAGFTACGGSLAGNWRVVATEVDIEHSPRPARPGVPEKPASCGRYVTSASWNAAGVIMSFVPATSSDPDFAFYTRTIEGKQSFVETLSVSAVCASEGFGGATCDSVAASLEPDAETTCDTSAAPCTCTAILIGATPTTVMLAAHDGEYAADDGTAGEYCRKGQTLEQAQRGATGNIVAWMQLQKI